MPNFAQFFCTQYCLLIGDGAHGGHNGHVGAGGSCNSKTEAEFEDGGVLPYVRGGQKY